jgi:hypothetical protein
MIEAKWLAATDSVPMLEFLRGKASDRKLRLLAVAMARLFPRQLVGVLFTAVEMAERIADGPVDESERLEAVFRLERVIGDFDMAHGNWYRKAPWEERYAYFATKNALGGIALTKISPDGADWRLSRQANAEFHPALVRDIFNPFHAGIDPSWLTSTVTALAQQMYEAREFSAMPILADALEDAGCADEQVLNHSRGPGPHVRGCWVVDACLKKE